jgi:hypothetical protein
MPYRKTDAREWTRRNGKVILYMEAGAGLDPAQEAYVQLPLHYGPKARLILFYLNTAAIRTRSRVIEAEGSMTSFIRELQSGTGAPQPPSDFSDCNLPMDSRTELTWKQLWSVQV